MGSEPTGPLRVRRAGCGDMVNWELTEKVKHLKIRLHSRGPGPCPLRRKEGCCGYICAIKGDINLGDCENCKDDPRRK